MPDPKALVGNAEDKEQLRKARSITTNQRLQFEHDLGEMVRTPQGRRFMWDLFRRTRIYESIWHPSAAIHYNAGQQDIGHEYQGEFVRLYPEQYFLMIKENAHVTT